jgi:hypothetical protein
MPSASARKLFTKNLLTQRCAVLFSFPFFLSIASKAKIQMITTTMSELATHVEKKMPLKDPGNYES